MNLINKKNFLFIQRSAPFDGARAAESQLALMATAALELDVSVLFINQGVGQLCRHQMPQTLGLKDFSLAFKLLSMYEVRNVYVDSRSLQKYRWDEDDLLLPVTRLNPAEISVIIHQHDIVLSY